MAGIDHAGDPIEVIARTDDVDCKAAVPGITAVCLVKVSFIDPSKENADGKHTADRFVEKPHVASGNPVVPIVAAIGTFKDNCDEMSHSCVHPAHEDV